MKLKISQLSLRFKATALILATVSAALGISAVTDGCLPDSLGPAEISEIIAIANAAEPRLNILVRGVLARMA